jgi:hypothetical protein
MELLLGIFALILLGVATVPLGVDSRIEINDENRWHVV